MARRFRWWEKKRGSRQTGSKVLGGAAEALFFAVLFFVGILALTELVVLRSFAESHGFLTDGWGLWLSALALASLILIGAGGLIYAAMMTGTSAERRSALAKRASDIELVADAGPRAREYPTVPRDANWTNSPGISLAYRLPITSSPAWRLLVVAMFCLIWNGAVAVLAVLALNQREIGRPDWSFVLLVSLFAGLGMAALVYMFQLLLVATAIGPTSVEVSDQPLFPGNEYQVYLSQAGNLAMNHFELRLVCDEEVTYAQGTDTRVERQRVYDQPVFRCEGFDILRGLPFEYRCSIEVPKNAMHSFLSRHNSIQWKLVVHAAPKQWPAYERTFPVVVYPGSSVSNGEPSK